MFFLLQGLSIPVRLWTRFCQRFNYRLHWCAVTFKGWNRSCPTDNDKIWSQHGLPQKEAICRNCIIYGRGDEGVGGWIILQGLSASIPSAPMCHFSNLTSKRIAPLTLPYFHLENLNPLASTPFPLRVAHVCYVIHIFWLCLEWRSRVCFKGKLPHLHDTSLSHTLYWNYIALRILIQTFHIRKLCKVSIYCTKLISFHPYLFWLWSAFHFLHKL